MMPSVIDPKGWFPWVGASAPNTIFYPEFANYGAGVVTKDKVIWKGLKFIAAKQASKFSVIPFIQGDKWLKDTDMSYKSGL
ncbi:putative hydrolase [Helianthus annuus]|nr:putative hydrolase [Helianthus annuus]